MPTMLDRIKSNYYYSIKTKKFFIGVICSCVAYMFPKKQNHLDRQFDAIKRTKKRTNFID